MDYSNPVIYILLIWILDCSWIVIYFLRVKRIPFEFTYLNTKVGSWWLAHLAHVWGILKILPTIYLCGPNLVACINNWIQGSMYMFKAVWVAIMTCVIKKLLKLWELAEQFSFFRSFWSYQNSKWPFLSIFLNSGPHFQKIFLTFLTKILKPYSIPKVYFH